MKLFGMMAMKPDLLKMRNVMQKMAKEERGFCIFGLAKSTS